MRVSDVDRRLAEQLRSRDVDYPTAVARGLFKPVGQGDAAVGDVIEALQRQRYLGWYGIEIETRLQSASDDPLAAVRESLAMLRTMLPAGQGRR